MNGFFEPAEVQEKYSKSILDSKGKCTLTSKQVNSLYKILPTEERKEFDDTFWKCFFESVATYSIPCTALTVGALYMARTKSPFKYLFNNKQISNLPLFVTGYLMFGAATFVGVDKTTDVHLAPKVDLWWQKYGGAESATNHAALRDQHRRGGRVAGLVPDNTPMPVAGEQRANADDTHAPRVRNSGSQKRQDTYAYSDTFMSGTPTGAPRDQYSGSQTKKGNQLNSYGDEGFS